MPRVVLIAAVVILAGGGLTFAATRTLAPATTPTSTTPLVQKLAVLIVPDVRTQPFVFAKGTLQDAGFSWRVIGAVRGFPANRVVAQSLPAGTRVLDNGAPVVKLTLERNKKYPQQGTPQDVSPYPATNAVLADAAGQPLETPAPVAPATTTPAAPAPTATTPATPTTPAPAPPVATTPAAPTTTTPAPESAPAATTPAPAPAPATPAPAAKAAAAAPAYPQNRPVAFAVAGAPKEPLDEMPLLDRAKLLGSWVAAHPKPTDAAVKHWLYQNEWIVTGARFGWWRGAEALQTLIQVDRRTVARWGIGAKSEAVAVGALAEVRTRSH